MISRDEIISALIKANIPSPRLEADIILSNGAPEYPNLTKDEDIKIREMLKRRINHEPLDKIIGYREFYKSVFKVNQNVLTPRPDTEILVESALQKIPENASWRILDLGTGSGCILLSLLRERKNCIGTGVDISKEALDVAKENATALGVVERTTLINKSWIEDNFAIGKYDMIVSNPPYIPRKEITLLEKEVKEFDPMLALDGGDDGLECYRQIANISTLLLKDDGYICLEVGYNQAEVVKDIFLIAGLKEAKIIPDLSGINRCVILKK